MAHTTGIAPSGALPFTHLRTCFASGSASAMLVLGLPKLKRRLHLWSHGCRICGLKESTLNLVWSDHDVISQSRMSNDANNRVRLWSYNILHLLHILSSFHGSGQYKDLILCTHWHTWIKKTLHQGSRRDEGQRAASTIRVALPLGRRNRWGARSTRGG